MFMALGRITWNRRLIYHVSERNKAMKEITTLYDSEKQRLIEKMLKLTDLYYNALDAGKSRKATEISKCLLPQTYPHFLEKNPNKSYHSPSVIGLIYDTVKGYQSENASIRDVV